MVLNFHKYQGAGNDFIILDNRDASIPRFDVQVYNHLCDRKFGIGADGLMILESHPDFDFKMVYFNADGTESSMCGNGGRCIVRFAESLGLVKDESNFLAVDGPHYAKISDAIIELKMIDVNHVLKIEDDYQIFTGSPHYIKWVHKLKDFDVYNKGKAIRYHKDFEKDGINVNFIEEIDSELYVRTYERGVENETLSCGTGVTASAIAYATEKKLMGAQSIKINTPGGVLRVEFVRTEQGFEFVYLIGPATYVYSGSIEIPMLK